MSLQKGTLVLYNKEKQKYYTYKVEMINGIALKIFSDGIVKDSTYRLSEDE